jgi:hypothetical protein
MATTILPAIDYANRRQMWVWQTLNRYPAGDVVLHDSNLYKVLVTHTSSNMTADIASGYIQRMVTKKVSATYYDIGPFTSQAGYSGNIDTGAKYVSLYTNEVVVGYFPTASNSDNGGWSDGGRATVRFGFALRIARINRQ